MVATQWRHTPHEFRLSGVQLQTTGTHVPQLQHNLRDHDNDIVMGGSKLAQAVELRVVSVLVRVEAVLLHQMYYVAT